MREFQSFDEFTGAVCDSLATVLNGTAEGQQLTDDLLRAKLAQNRNLTPEEWAKTKQEFMLYLFHELITSNEKAHDDFTRLLYEELRKQP